MRSRRSGVIAALILIGILIASARKNNSSAALITLAGDSITNVTAVDDHLLMVDGMQMNYINSDGSIQWSVPLPEAGLLRRGELWFRCFSGPDWEAAVCGLSAPPECIFWEK